MLAQELCQSEFRPLRFEYPIGEQEGTRPLRLGTASGDEVRVEGKVDRVDCYHGSDRDYIRVIDYKTGGKNLTFRKWCGASICRCCSICSPWGKTAWPIFPAPGKQVFCICRAAGISPGTAGRQRREHCRGSAQELLHERYGAGQSRGHRGHGTGHRRAVYPGEPQKGRQLYSGKLGDHRGTARTAAPADRRQCGADGRAAA